MRGDLDQARAKLSVWLLVAALAALLATAGCAPEKNAASAPPIPAGEHDPAVWGKVYPEVYRQWLATQEPRPADKSEYKRGYDDGVMYDKLSEFPFMALLFKGWGFGIDYKEPRGHFYMLTDQAEADPARVKAGGACITCKSSYAQDLQAKNKSKLFASTYDQAVAMIPEQHRKLGVTCIDCHDTSTLELATRRWTVDAALNDIGLKSSELNTRDKRLMVCGQCHATYSVMKDNGQSVDVDFPWEGGKNGAVTVEVIINNLETQKARLEWTQEVTGFKLGFIRHPDVEFYSAGSPHYAAGVTCNDCHMTPAVSNQWVADHDIISPLKRDMVACSQCHADSAQEMRDKVRAIQNRSLTELIDAGYRVAELAKLFELANRSLETTSGDPRYDAAAEHYRQAFYRVDYMGAENSVGFHNPAEATRILGDARTEAIEAEAGLRALLKSKGVKAPKEVNLELSKYLEDRGVRKLGFVREQYIHDPTGRAEKKWDGLGSLLK